MTEPQWRRQSQRGSPPAALLNANQQAERPTRLLGDWERGPQIGLGADCEWTETSFLLTVATFRPSKCVQKYKQLLKLVAARERAPDRGPDIKPAQTSTPSISIHAESRPSQNYSSYWCGDYPLSELGAVPLKPDFPCWDAGWRPFSKRPIATGRFIYGDIYENFMGGSCFRLWHFKFPLKLGMWWLFFFQPPRWKKKQQQTGARMVDGTDERGMRERMFSSLQERLWTRGDGGSSLGWHGSSFHWLLTLLKW